MNTKLPSNSAGQWMRFAALTLALASAAASAQTVLRTQGYHQLTTFTNRGVVNNGHDIAISGDGRKIACAINQNGTNLTYAVNFDGTALTLVDLSPSSSETVNISDDGSVVMSAGSSYGWENHARIANPDGSNGHEAIHVTGTYAQFRLSPKGDRVFFVCDRSFDSVPSPGAREGGIYSVKTDGTGFTNILSMTRLTQFFSVGADNIWPSGVGGTVWLAVSGDGSNLLYSIQVTNAPHLLAIKADGSGLRDVPMAQTGLFRIDNFGLNGDGSKIFYNVALAPCCSSGGELGIMNPDGTGRVVLYRGDTAWAANTLQMSRDGSKLHSSDLNVLFNTDGSGKRELGGHTDSMVMHWGLYQLVMSTNATRFAFLANPYNNSSLLQIGTMEINPTNSGSAPVLSQTAATPPYLLTNGTPSTFLTTRASPSTNLFQGNVMVDVLLNGMHDLSTEDYEPLVDGGYYGDATAGDGLYSNNRLYAYPWGIPSQVAPRTLRFKSELADSNSMYHATIVEWGPFWVLAQAPSGPAPSITTISPPNAGAGTTVTLTGTGFDPIATNNVILFGTASAQVISVNPGGTQLVVVVPVDAGVGAVNVSVGSQGQTGSPTIYNLPGGEPNWLEITMLAGVNIAGVNIHGNAGKTYRVDYLSDIHNTNNWVPLATNVLPSNPWFWADLGSTNQPHRYYRTVELP